MQSVAEDIPGEERLLPLPHLLVVCVLSERYDERDLISRREDAEVDLAQDLDEHVAVLPLQEGQQLHLVVRLHLTDELQGLCGNILFQVHLEEVQELIALSQQHKEQWNAADVLVEDEVLAEISSDK